MVKERCGYFKEKVAFLDVALVNVPLYSFLLSQGWRRSGEIVYRNSCPHCGKCKIIRLNPALFVPSKSQRRVLRRNSDIQVTFNFDSTQFMTDEKLNLFERYKVRHREGIPDDSGEVFSVNTTEESKEELSRLNLGFSNCINMEYRLGDRLVGVGIVDVGEGVAGIEGKDFGSGLSSSYFYFDPDREVAVRSLGVFSVLKEVEYALHTGLDWYYLGYYIEDCDKMNYKANYRPCEIISLGGYIDG